MFASLLDANFTPALVAALVAFALAVVLVVTQDWHGHLSIDTHIGVQKFHTHPTPRVGGIAILLGLAMGYFLAGNSVQALLWPLMLAGIPAFAFGLLEDITKTVSVRTRLIATMACGVLGWAITGLAITRVNVPGVDMLLGFPIIAVTFTAFAVGGVANAINIIDGFNGLASGTVIIILTGMGVISLGVGDLALAGVCMLLAASVGGFLLVNWPLGKLFLGDGGAYFIGFAIAWVAVLLLARHPEISAWAPLLVCGFPVLEVVFSIIRRHRRGLSPGDPDRLHLHSLVKRRVVKQVIPHARNLVRNSATGALMWVVAAVPVVFAVAFPTDTAGLAVGLLVCAFMYSALYIRLTQFGWGWRATNAISVRNAKV